MLAQQQKGINWSLNKFNLQIRRFLSVTAVKSWNSFATGAVGAENQTLLNWSSEVYTRCAGTVFAYMIASQVVCSTANFYMMFIILLYMYVFIYIYVHVRMNIHMHLPVHTFTKLQGNSSIYCTAPKPRKIMNQEGDYLDYHKAISACEKLDRFMSLKSLGSGYKL